MNDAFSRDTLRALRTLSLAYFIQATGALSVVGSLEAISTTWSLENAQTAYLISVFGVTFAIAAPLLQVAFGHIRRRRQVLLGLGVFSSAALLFAVGPNYTVLLLSRILMGLGAAFVGPVLAALGASLVARDQQGSAIAVVLLGLSVSGLVGMPLSAWIAHEWGARALFLLVALGGFGTACLIKRFVPDQSAGEKVPLSSVVSLLTTTGSASAFLVVFFIAAGVYATYAFIEPIVRDVYHGSPHAVSLSLLVLGVAGVFGNLFVTRAARRFSAEQMLVCGIALLAADLGLLWYAPPHFGLLFVALTVWAFATDILWPSQQRRIIELTPHLRGVALAITASSVFCGIGLGSAAAGHIYPTFGYGGLLTCSLAFLALAVLSLGISRAAVRAGRIPLDIGKA